MLDISFLWERFWCSREGTINLTDAGFLPDPTDSFVHTMYPDVKPFHELVGTRALILLGEPGIGKSTTVRREANRRKRECATRTVKFIDLNAFQTDASLRAEILSSPEMVDWKRGTEELELYFDSLDECRLRIENIGNVLVETLGSLPLDRLSVRVASRPAAFPEGLIAQLKVLFGSKHVGIYELCPLRRKDVEDVALAVLERVDSFLDATFASHAVPLAAVPVTLMMLIDVFRTKRELPSSRTELYDRAVKALAAENSRSRHDSGKPGMPTEQRVVIAARIAYCTQLLGVEAIHFGRGRSEGDANIDDLIGSHPEPYTAGTLTITLGDLREVLDTGLFSGRGPDRVGWAHKTFAEFLTSKYINGLRFTYKTILKLLAHPDGVIFPQVEEVAVWIAGLRSDLFLVLARQNPIAMLRADPTQIDAKARAGLFDALVEHHRTTSTRRWYHSDSQFYGVLCHEGIEARLHGLIRDLADNSRLRIVAMQIASACKLQSALARTRDIALDPSEALDVRAHAAAAVRRSGDNFLHASLKPLALGGSDRDPDHELKGIGLSVCWPHALTASELFDCLNEPPSPNLIGTYDRFLRSDFVGQVNPEDLPIAIAWVEQVAASHLDSDALLSLADRVLTRSLSFVSLAEVRRTLSRATIVLASKHFETYLHSRSVFLAALAADNTARQMLLDHLYFDLVTYGMDAHFLRLHDLVYRQDVGWLMEKSFGDPDEDRAVALAQTAYRMTPHDDVETFDTLICHLRFDTRMQKHFALLLEGVALNSETATELREWHELLTRRDHEVQTSREPSAHLIPRLEADESGQANAFVSVVNAMQFDGRGRRRAEISNDQLTDYPGWKYSTPAIQSRIVAAARRHLETVEPNVEAWHPKGQMDWPTLFGWFALLLLWSAAEEQLDQISPVAWRHWLPVILTCPTNGGSGSRHRVESFLIRALPHASEELLKTVELLAQSESSKLESALGALRELGSPGLDALLFKLAIQTASGAIFRVILADFARRVPKTARQIATEVFEKATLEHSEPDSKKSQAAVFLLSTDSGDTWSQAWAKIADSEAFALHLLAEIGNSMQWRRRSFGEQLSESQLGDLFLWIHRHNESPREQAKFEIRSSRADVDYLRDHVLFQLTHRGTGESVNVMQDVMHKLPNADWLKREYETAITSTRQQEWKPLLPVQALKLAAAEREAAAWREKPIQDRLEHWLKQYKYVSVMLLVFSFLVYLAERLEVIQKIIDFVKGGR